MSLLQFSSEQQLQTPPICFLSTFSCFNWFNFLIFYLFFVFYVFVLNNEDFRGETSFSLLFMRYYKSGQNTAVIYGIIMGLQLFTVSKCLSSTYNISQVFKQMIDCEMKCFGLVILGRLMGIQVNQYIYEVMSLLMDDMSLVSITTFRLQFYVKYNSCV